MSTDLADAFAKPNRAAGLQPPPPRATTPITTTPVAETPPPPTRARTAPAANNGRAIIQVSVALRDRLRAVATTKNKTYRDVIFDAVEATIDDLPDLLEHHSQATTNTELFERASTRPHTTTEGRVQVTIRGLTPQNRAVLNDLVQRTHAPSMTALLTAALEAHLPERPRALRG